MPTAHERFGKIPNMVLHAARCLERVGADDADTQWAHVCLRMVHMVG